MASFELQNFKPGLDTRRNELTTIPGALLSAVNVHINQGGEIEKRKAIALDATMPSGTDGTYGVWQTYGGQEIPTGIVVFGSVPSATVGAMPVGATGTQYFYQQLQHPAVLNGTAYSHALHSMTGIVSTTLFGAYAFAIATFADGTTWAYYNGNLVVDFTAGLILTYLAGSNTLIATNIKNLLDATKNYALSTATSNFADAIGPVGTQYTVSEVLSTAAGTLTAQIKNQGLAPVPGGQAVGAFQIVAGAAGSNNFISVVKLVGAAGQAGTNLLYNSVAINWGTTIYDTAIAVANSISQYAGTTGYYAIAAQNTVSIYAVVVGTSTGNYPLSVQVNINTSGNFYNICVGNCAIVFSGAGSSGSFAVTQIAAGATNLLGSTASGSSLNAMVIAIAEGINAHGTGYCACAIGNTLYLSKGTTASTDAAVTITVTTGTGVTTGSGSTGGTVVSLSTYLESATCTVNCTSNGRGTYTITSVVGSVDLAPVPVIISGTTNGPYSYAWAAVGTPQIPLVASSKTTYQAVFDTTTMQNLANSPGPSGTYTYSATYNCTVTDASANVFTTSNLVVNVTVKFIG